MRASVRSFFFLFERAHPGVTRERQRQHHRRSHRRIYRDGEFVRTTPLRESQSAWQLLTTASTANSKAEYTPRPGVYAPKKVEEVVTTIAGDADEDFGGGRLKAGFDTFYDYVDNRSPSASPILTRRRIRSTER